MGNCFGTTQESPDDVLEDISTTIFTNMKKKNPATTMEYDPKFGGYIFKHNIT